MTLLPPTSLLRHRPLRLLGGLVAVGAAALLALSGCEGNEVFDPNTVANVPPTVRLFVGPVDPDGELNPTSYYNRTFHWSGGDVDGWVVSYDLSIRTDRDTPAPWITTTRTDTTMTFVTNEDGESEATFYLRCTDNRGAQSETLVQFIPMRNFTPAVGFQSDFDPLPNMQREILGNAPGDTIYWTFGAANFRCFAFDLDGADTMDPYYRYTVAEGEPGIVWDHENPLADPETGWIEVPFAEGSEIKEFQIFLTGLSAGEKTLRIRVVDEADAVGEYPWSWQVREPQSPVLYIPDNSGPNAEAYYGAWLDERYGAGGWDTYDFWFGFPDAPFVLLESLRRFEVVIWADGGSPSQVLRKAASLGGVLQQFVMPPQGVDAEPGKLMMISRGVTGNQTGLAHPFIQQVLGISPTGSPQSPLEIPVDSEVLREDDQGLAMVATQPSAGNNRAMGLNPLSALTTALYRLAYCQRCYSVRPPYDPVVGVVFHPILSDGVTTSTTVSFGIHMENFDTTQGHAVLNAVLDDVMEVAR